MFVSNSLLEQVVLDLPNINLKSISSSEKKRVSILRLKGDIGHIGEIWLNHAIKVCAQKYEKIETNPINECGKGRFYFETRKKERVDVLIRHTDMSFTDLDCVAIVDKLPTLFEINLGGNNRIKQLFESRIYKRVEAMTEYFETRDIGVVVVLQRNEFEGRSKNRYKDFKMMGGTIVPFYTDIENLKRSENTSYRHL